MCVCVGVSIITQKQLDLSSPNLADHHHHHHLFAQKTQSLTTVMKQIQYEQDNKATRALIVALKI